MARIKQETKIRSLLQKEINSRCPMPSCDSTDVEHFQIHHIDEDPTNDDFPNLILVCPTCHSKITKGDIPKKTVELIKKKLPTSKQSIQFVTVTIDSKNCSWMACEDVQNAFKNINNNKSPFPILSFSFINHTKKTTLLTALQLKAKNLYGGISGIPKPHILKSIIKYNLGLPNTNEVTKLLLEDQIVVPAERAFKFQVQLYENWNEQTFPIEGKKVLFFTFEFNGNILIEVPKIFLNCRSEDEKFTIQVIS
jgi:hypothetical protein